MFPKKRSFSAVVGEKTRRSFHLLVGATLTIGTAVIGSRLTAVTSEQSLWSILGWLAAGIIVTFFYLRWQLQSQEESPEAIKERVSHLEPELRKQVQARSYGTRRNLIEAPLRELDLEITPRLGWVRDPRLVEPEPLSKQSPDDAIVAAFESSKRRLLIVGEPGSGKTMAAYSLIEYLGKDEGAEGRIPLLVNLSAWEAQETFEAFLVDYLCSSVGYEVRERAVASAFIKSDRYVLILDGLDEIPLRLRAHFSERLDEFVQGLADEVGVVVTCRTEEYEELLAAHYSTGLGLVQAVEILPLTSEQLDSAFVELAQRDKDWGSFLSQRHLTAYKRVRHLLSNPLFLNLTVLGHLRPGQLLDFTTTEQDLRDLVLERYIERTLADQSHYEMEDARRYLSRIARFLNGAEVSPFGLKTTDYTVFDLADLTPPEPPRGYRLFAWVIWGLVLGLSIEVILALFGGAAENLPLGVLTLLGLTTGMVAGLLWETGAVLLSRWTSKRSALSSRLTFVWPSTKQRRHDFLRRAGQGWFTALVLGLAAGFLSWSVGSVISQLPSRPAPAVGLSIAVGLTVGLVLVLVRGLVDTRPVLIVNSTPKEASSRSMITALLYVLIAALLSGLLGGVLLVLSLLWLEDYGLAFLVLMTLIAALVYAPPVGLVVGIFWGLNNGGWFVVLQKIAHRRLARAGNLPSPPYDFLEWGIASHIFRRVGGGVRFRHNLIQQHLASTSD